MKNKTKLISIVLFFSALMVLVFCRKQEKVEKIIEDGVEIIVNHLEPYKIKGEQSTLHLEEEFTIDTERDEIIKVGLADIGHYFEVDSDGNIYIVSPKSKENIIFKFERTGKFISSFGRWGKGPGEIVSRPFPPLFITINLDGKIEVTNFYGRNLVYFNEEGDFVGEEKLESNLLVINPLENGNLLVYGRPKGPISFTAGIPLNLCDEEFNIIKELGVRKIPNEYEEKKIEGIYYTLSWAVSKGMIYTGKQEEGYDIKVYDSEGNLIRRIKKKYRPVPLTEEYKKDYLKTYEINKEFLAKLYFPKNFPPFHSFFTDDNGRLFVMTYERGERPGEYIYDIFNEEGLFVGRKSLKVHHHPDGLFAIIKNNHLYCLQEKESSYKELVVYRVTWEK